MPFLNKSVIAFSTLLTVSLGYGAAPNLPAPKNYEGDFQYYLYRNFERCINEAEVLYAATLYELAAAKYEELYQTAKTAHSIPGYNSADLLALTSCRLGQISFFLGDFKLANSYFHQPRAAISSLSPPLLLLEMQAAYTSAVAYRRLGLYTLAIEALDNHADMAAAFQNSLMQEAQYERALNNYLLNNTSIAKEQFQRFSPSNSPLDLYYLAQLYLGRIELSEHNYESAKKRFAILHKEMLEDNNLHYELAYLKGFLAFQEEHFEQAIELLQHSLPKRKLQIPTDADWTADALSLLGWSYLKAAEQPNATPEYKREMFQKSEEVLKLTVDERGAESDYLALSQCYLTKGHCLQDKEAMLSADTTLRQYGDFSSLEAKAQSLLLRAEIAEDYETKEKLYVELTKKAYDSIPHYVQGWYKRGFNDYSRGEGLQKDQPAASRAAFKRAAYALKFAYPLLQPLDQAAAEKALKLYVRAQLQEGSPESLLAIIKTVDTLTKEEAPVLTSMLEQKELLYLYGLAACKLVEQTENEKFIEVADKALWSASLDAPGKNFADEALQLLGLFYFRRAEYRKSEEAFLHLVVHYPQSPLAADSLHYCAESAEKLGKDPELIKSYRQQIFETYPMSPQASSAYFHYYPYREYLQGGKEALKHLKNFLETFPNSPLSITAHFLMGLDYERDRTTIEGRSIRKKNLLKAIEAFTEVERQFEELSSKDLIAAEDFPYYVNIRYRSLLERALANQIISEESQGTKREIYFQYAEELYKKIFQEFTDSKHPLASSLTKSEPFPRAYEESLYALIQGYRKMNQLEPAKKLINEAIGKYDDLGINKGYYLSRIFYELGALEMQNDSHELAWHAFTHAEDSSSGKFLSTEQKLDLWIQQALCYKALGQMDKAMLVLSKVINDDAVSGLRLKAMFLRAEIYEQQGRLELARKQLEATAKKGGEWAHKAKIKLDMEYGY